MFKERRMLSAMMLKTVEIASEDELLAYLMKHYNLGKFAKVDRISTYKISPDIDLLDVNEHQQIAEERGILTGYEIKLLKYRKDWKRVNLNPMHKGIGQALSYFQFGVDKSILVLGKSNDIPRESVSSTISEIESVIESFNTLRAFDARIRKYFDDSFKETPMLKGVKGLLLETYCGWNCFGIMVWTAYDDLLVTKLSAEQCFPIYMNEKLKHRKECLLRKEFKYKEGFLEKHLKSKRDGERGDS